MHFCESVHETCFLCFKLHFFSFLFCRRLPDPSPDVVEPPARKKLKMDAPAASGSADLTPVSGAEPHKAAQQWQTT